MDLSHQYSKDPERITNLKKLLLSLMILQIFEGLKEQIKDAIFFSWFSIELMEGRKEKFHHKNSHTLQKKS